MSRYWIAVIIIMALFTVLGLRRAERQAAINENKFENIDGLESITTLLETDPNDKGFIIFMGKTDNMYVQYAREDFGLLLDWPIFNNRKERNFDVASKAIEVLEKYGITFYEESDSRSGNNFKYKKVVFIKNNENWTSLNVNVGDNAEEIYNITIELFSYVFNFNDIDNLKIELVLEDN